MISYGKCLHLWQIFEKINLAKTVAEGGIDNFIEIVLD